MFSAPDLRDECERRLELLTLPYFLHPSRKDLQPGSGASVAIIQGYEDLAGQMRSLALIGSWGGVVAFFLLPVPIPHKGLALPFP